MATVFRNGNDVLTSERNKKIQEGIWDFFCEKIEAHDLIKREGQENMALDIGDAINNQQHLIVEAGVGIGKSFAYIVPLILHHRYFGQPLIIATSTIALQEQLARDIQKVCGILHYPLEVVIAKGQTHYICQRRIDDLADSPLKKTLHEVIKTGGVERKDFGANISDSEWNKVRINNYRKKTCSLCCHLEYCHYISLRTKMRDTDQLIVCNQDLLTVHLQNEQRNGNGLLPQHSPIIVIDEAHNLEDKVRASLTTQFSQTSLINTIQSATAAIRSIGRDVSKKVVALEDIIQEFFQTLKVQVEKQISSNAEHVETGRFFFVASNEECKQIRKITAYLVSLDNDVQIESEWAKPTEAQRNAGNELTNLADRFPLCADAEKNIVWIEKNSNYTNLELCVCPGDIPARINRLFFQNSHKTILTSATLTNQKTGTVDVMYDYFVKQIGFNHCLVNNPMGYLADPKPSPFPYDQHAMIYYASDLPHPTKDKEKFIQQGSDRIIELLKLSGGRALILFTSKNDLNAVYDNLKDRNLPFALFKPENGSSQEKTLANFREDNTSVLLGTGAYWEGIDMAGDTLTNVIIFRLPFPVPDPIIDDKCKKAKDKLLEVLVPEMIVKLNQGVGRLIRSESDVGIVSILDPRLADSSNSVYRNIVWDALPIKNRTSDFLVLTDFYQCIVDGKAA